MVDRKLAQRGKETSNRNYWNDLFLFFLDIRAAQRLIVACLLSIYSLSGKFSIDFVKGFHLSLVIVVW